MVRFIATAFLFITNIPFLPSFVYGITWAG
jgi:hypothetical protein